MYNFINHIIFSTIIIPKKIYLKFIINKKGMVSDVEVLRGEDKYLREEAIRLVKTLPRLKPAKLNNGKVVSVYYTIPINFQLN
tara:strand:- start:433 stop:681 length:249 start_codon:yes stop_codon:yes gene_type:complete